MPESTRNNLFTDFAGHTTNAYYGVDINNFPGSLIQNNGTLVRLNTNFTHHPLHGERTDLEVQRVYRGVQGAVSAAWVY